MIVAIYISGHSIHNATLLSGSREPLIYPPSFIRHTSFGYDGALADSLWLRTIQDFDFCGQEREQKEGGLVSEEEEKRSHRCQRGWSYYMLDAISELDPRFKIVYTNGATYLSIIVDDIQGATDIYEKGLKVYPEDWILLYRAAYHKLYEEQDVEKAAELFHRAGLHGAPDWVHLLSARLYSEIGQVEIGLATLMDFLGETPFEEWPVAAQERWNSLQSRKKEIEERRDVQ